MTLNSSLSSRFKDTLDKTRRLITHTPSPSNSVPSSPTCSTSSTFSMNDTPSLTPTSVRSSVSGISSEGHLEILLAAGRVQSQRRSEPFIRLPRSSSGSVSGAACGAAGTMKRLSAVTIPRHRACTYSAGVPVSGLDFTEAARFELSSSPDAQKDAHLDDLVLLPICPEDTSIPPCSAAELTPETPHPLTTRPPMVSHSTTSTVSTRYTTASEGTEITEYSSQETLENSDTKCLYTCAIKDIDPLYVEVNQIDHCSRQLDAHKTDQMADQMALNILQNIAEEEVDELTRFKQELMK